MEFIKGQHVIASDRISGGRGTKGVIIKIDLTTDRFHYRIDSRESSFSGWYAQVELDPDFKAENDVIAEITTHQVGDTVMYRDYDHQDWFGPSAIIDINLSPSVKECPYQVAANGCWYRQVKLTHLTSFDGVSIGTRLKVREDLIENQLYGTFTALSEMYETRGRMVTVDRITEQGNVTFKGNSYIFPPEMFECIITDAEDIIDESYTVTLNDLTSAFADPDICQPWKNKILSWAMSCGTEEPFFTLDQINEMKEAADFKQLELINSLFPELKQKLPEVNELIWVWDDSKSIKTLRFFRAIGDNKDYPIMVSSNKDSRHETPYKNCEAYTG